jgi:hypothetical protein
MKDATGKTLFIDRKHRKRFDSILEQQIRLTRAANLKPKEAIQYLNSGNLGYTDEPLLHRDGTIQTDDRGNPKYRPNTIDIGTYYNWLKKIEDPLRDWAKIDLLIKFEGVKALNDTISMFHELRAQELRNLWRETDTVKKQMIINSIYRNSVFLPAFIDGLKTYLENNKDVVDSTQREINMVTN